MKGTAPRRSDLRTSSLDTPDVSHPPWPGGQRWAATARVSTLAASDLATLLLSAMLAFLLWASPIRNQGLDLYVPVSPVLLLFLLGYAQAGLYPGFSLGPVETLRRYWLVTTGVFVAVAAAVFALKVPHLYSRMTVGLTYLFALVLVPGGRWLVLRLARRRPWWAEPAVLVGTGAHTERVRKVLAEKPGVGFRPVGILTDDPEAFTGNLPVLGSVDDAHRFAGQGIRVAFTDVSAPGVEGHLDHLRALFPKVITLRDFEEIPVEVVQIRNLGGVLGLEYANNLLRRQNRWIKRAMDLAIATVALVLTTPLILVSVALVKLLSPGPAFFWQLREGRRGRAIRVPKIRTMAPDAEARLEEHFLQDPALKEEWENGFKLSRDPRIVPVVGRVLRRFSIDELPQLWSVIRGDMSLVGPRPFPWYHLEALSPRSRDLRKQVRPGLTGLWQVIARGVADVGTQESYDLYYVRNWSLWLDLYILAKTVSAVISGRGAY